MKLTYDLMIFQLCKLNIFLYCLHGYYHPTITNQYHERFILKRDLKDSDLAIIKVFFRDLRDFYAEKIESKDVTEELEQEFERRFKHILDLIKSHIPKKQDGILIDEDGHPRSLVNFIRVVSMTHSYVDTFFTPGYARYTLRKTPDRITFEPFNPVTKELQHGNQSST